MCETHVKSVQLGRALFDSDEILHGDSGPEK